MIDADLGLSGWCVAGRMSWVERLKGRNTKKRRGSDHIIRTPPYRQARRDLGWDGGERLGIGHGWSYADAGC
jgi:hypothetical protein